ncbi:calcium-binding protein [Acaryochloris marina NIES-2412]|uniref:calcium-binding protein n=1 Tax=Acaryochloris marina TaxID=155978 RepID=UPI004059EBEB
MVQVKQDEVREERITMEIVVDAYTAEEQALGWYYYLEQTLQFPFIATYMMQRRDVPEKEAKSVKVISMADEEECENEMFVEVEWDGDVLPIRLEELTFERGDGEQTEEMTAKTQEAIEDWHYWVNRGYTFEE